MTDHKGALTHYSELASQAGLVKALEARVAALDIEALKCDECRVAWRKVVAALAAVAEPSGSAE